MASGKLPVTGFLSSASANLRDMLAAQATETVLDTGQMLFAQGDEGDAFYAIMSGALEISVVSTDGRKLALDVMYPGALLGEIALFDPGTRTATVTALEPSRLRRVANADVMRAVRASPDLAIDLIRLAGQRMRWINTQLQEQAFLPMPTRLARKILYLTRDNPEPHPTLQLSQADLADFIGATREGVSKTLTGWKRLGVVDSARGELTVLDRQALEALAKPGLI